MNLLTPEIRAALLANMHARRNAQAQGEREPDPVPVARFFNPLGAATWLATELDEDGILFGLADLGLGCPELGSFSLRELQSLRLPFGLGVEPDILFETALPISAYVAAARQAAVCAPPLASTRVYPQILWKTHWRSWWNAAQAIEFTPIFLTCPFAVHGGHLDLTPATGEGAVQAIAAAPVTLKQSTERACQSGAARPS